jgi:hypothetical protein
MHFLFWGQKWAKCTGSTIKPVHQSTVILKSHKKDIFNQLTPRTPALIWRDAREINTKNRKKRMNTKWKKLIWIYHFILFHFSSK